MPSVQSLPTAVRQPRQKSKGQRATSQTIYRRLAVATRLQINRKNSDDHTYPVLRSAHVAVTKIGTRAYSQRPSPTPARTAHTSIWYLVLKPSFLWIPDTAFRTVSTAVFLISPIS